MWATVHLAWFDPQNEPPRTTTASLWQFDPNGDGNKKKDNIGVLSISPTTLEFTNKDNLPNNGAPTKYTVASFLEGFGDNFIVAAHPNGGVVNKYCFACDGKVLMQPNYEMPIPTTHRTSILYNAAWRGFKVPKGWGIHEEDENVYISTETLNTIQNADGTPIPGREHPGESYAKSVLKKDTFDTDMELTLSYKFDRTEGDGRGNVGSGLGYVLPFSQRAAPKLSFVANSGVKIGGKGGYESGRGPREIQIIDVNALVNMVDDAAGVTDKIDNFKFFDPNTGIQNDGQVKGLKATVPNLPYQQLPNPPTSPLQFAFPNGGEDVGMLMHGVAYGKYYENMVDFKLGTPRPLVPPFTWEDYWHALDHNDCITGGNSFDMLITWDSQSYMLTVELNGDKRYEESHFVPGNIFGSIYFGPSIPPQNRDGHIYLQSHWGSGVVFTSASFSPDKD